MSVSTSLTTQVHHRVGDLDTAALAPLLGAGGLYDTPDWLRYCESSAAGLLRHITVDDGQGRTVGFASMRVVPDHNVMSLYNLSSFLDQPSEQVFPSAVAAVSGAHCVLLSDPEADPATRSAQRRALATAIVNLAEEEGCQAVGFLYLRDEQSAMDVAEVLGKQTCPPFLAAAHTELVGGWPDFEHYLATLRSPRRNKIRRERKQFIEAGITTRVLHGTAELGEATARLQLALRHRYGAGGSVESILQDYRHLKAAVDDRVRVFLCERDGTPVGMSLALLDGDRLNVRLAGFDYTGAGADFLYFNAVYYEPILWGIEHGIAAYAFGTGTYGAKLARGCTPIPTYGVVRWPEPLQKAARQHVAHREQTLRAELGLPTAPEGAKSTQGAL